MKINLTFKENNQKLKLGFGQFQELTDGGYERGYAEGEKVGYANGYTEGETKGIEQGYNEGYIEGFNSAPPDYLPSVVTVKINNYNLFGRKEAVLNVPLVTNFGQAFQQNSATVNTTVEHLTINGSLDGTITAASMAFYSPTNETTLKRLTLNCDFSKCTQFTYSMTYLAALEVIDGVPIDFSSATTIGSFHNCPLGSSLREMRVTPNSIKVGIQLQNDNKLSDETIQSIIDGLADLTGQTTQKVTFHASVLARLTEEQINTIGAKNWLF